MREIKFRAWDKTRGVFNDTGYELDCDGTMIVQPDCILMQYTGIKDKNGTEVYEGDIIQFTPSIRSSIISDMRDEDPLKKIVYWDDDEGQWGWKMLNGTPEGSGYSFCKRNLETIAEVIGNIYENPELLK